LTDRRPPTAAVEANMDSSDGYTGHPKLGASWEGFVLEQTASQFGERNLYHWGTHGGAELDIFTQVNGQRLGIEIKHADAPTLSKSMHIARADLKLDRLLVVTPGTRSWPLSDWAEVVAIAELPARLAGFRAR
jgi:predicted AAA+ superfamily ATPase